MNELVMQTIPLVRQIAKSSTRRWLCGYVELDYDDLYQEGCVALVKAAAAYDPSRGVPFRKFASPLIKFAIIDALRKHGSHHSQEQTTSTGEIPLVRLDVPHESTVQDRIKVQDCFFRLGVREQYALVALLEGESLRVAAKCVGTSATSLFNLQKRGLKSLAEMMGVKST